MRGKRFLCGAKGGRAIDFAAGAAMGILVFLLIYGPSTLNVTYDSWIYAGYAEQDIVQRYAGWMFYRAADWGWPLTVAGNLGVPNGTSIVYTDSIPLAALFFKLLSPHLPANFQYFGLYNFLNIALQGGFAMWLVRHFRFGRAYSLLGSLLFLVTPIFLERVFRHDALASQWLILAALLLYLRARNREKFPFWGFWVLCVLAPAIHTYFVPMVYALLAAALCEYALRKRQWRHPLLWLGSCFAGTLVMAYALGILTRGGGGAAWGFGHYSMNLNALFNPSSFDVFAPQGYLHWSRLVLVQPQFEGQYDGFQYLGAGILLVWLCMAGYGLWRLYGVAKSKDKKPLYKAAAFLKTHIPLLVVCFCLFLFSLSHVVRFASVELFTLPLPQAALDLCGVFRASGRLFWPCTYLLTLAPLVFVGRMLPRRWPLLVLSLLVAVQLFDLSGILKQKHGYFAAGAIVVEDMYTSAPWRTLMQTHNKVFQLEPFYEYEMAAGIIRHNPEMQTNHVLANRGNFDAARIEQEETLQRLRQGERLEPGTLYLCRSPEMYEQLRACVPADTQVYEVGDCYLFAAP